MPFYEYYQSSASCPWCSKPLSRQFTTDTEHGMLTRLICNETRHYVTEWEPVPFTQMDDGSRMFDCREEEQGQPIGPENRIYKLEDPNE